MISREFILSFHLRITECVIFVKQVKIINVETVLRKVVLPVPFVM